MPAIKHVSASVLRSRDRRKSFCLGIFWPSTFSDRRRRAVEYPPRGGFQGPIGQTRRHDPRPFTLRATTFADAGKTKGPDLAVGRPPSLT